MHNLAARVEHLERTMVEQLQEHKVVNVNVQCGSEETQKEILALLKEIKTEVFRQSVQAQKEQVAEIQKDMEPTLKTLEDIAKE